MSAAIQAKARRRAPRTLQANRQVVIAHRGGAEHPENSLRAFAHAIALGVDGIECDIMLTADTTPAVYHDFRLKPRFTRRRDGAPMQRIALAEMSHARLRAYEIFSPARPARAAPIASFTQLCAMIARKAPPQFQFFVEIKSRLYATNKVHLATLISQVCAIIHRYGLEARTHFLSFDWRILELAKQILPDVPIACTTLPFQWTDPQAPLPKLAKKRAYWQAAQPRAPWWGGAYLPPGKPHGEQLLYAIASLGAQAWTAPYQDITPQLEQLARELKIKIYAWTVNDTDTLRAMAQRDIAAIITDYPMRAMDALRTVAA